MYQNNFTEGQIPSIINLDQIVDSVEGNTTRKRYLKDGMVYFLSLLYVDNYYDYKLTNGYRYLNDEVLTNVIGKGGKTSRTAEVKTLLKNHGVIEVLNYSQGHRSYGFRLSEPYNTGIYTTYTFSERITKKLKEYFTPAGDQKINTVPNHQHIKDQFTTNELGVDFVNAHQYLLNIYNGVSEKLKSIIKFKDLNKKSLLNYIGRSLHILNDIQNKNYHLKTSVNNHRFHSNLTSLPKYLRPFITINGENMSEIDIKSSQPYILSTILNERFFEDETEGYNLKTIFQDLKTSMVNTQTMVPSKKSGNNHYVMGVYMNKEGFNGIQNFCTIDFKEDFYSHLISEGNIRFPEYMSSVEGFKNGRDYAKKHMMNYLFERNDIYREKNEVIGLLKLLYPSVSGFIESFNQIYTNTDLSYLLQRTESYIMLNHVCTKLQISFPDTPYYTIHDCILTTQKNMNLVESFMSYTIKNLTGSKEVGLSKKTYNPISEISDQELNDIFNKIRITSLEDYNKKRTYILDSNIELGKELISRV